MQEQVLSNVGSLLDITHFLMFETWTLFLFVGNSIINERHDLDSNQGCPFFQVKSRVQVCDLNKSSCLVYWL